MKVDVLAELQKLISKELKKPVEKIVPQANLVDDLGADSVDSLELCFAVEEFFEVEITDDELSNMRTVRDAVELVTKKLVG